LKEQVPNGGPLKHTAVKEAVFSFTRFPGMDTVLGPVKRSFGIVMGIDDDFGTAFIKSQLAAGEDLPASGKVYLSVRNEDKRAFVSIAEQLVDLGFELVASDETAAMLKRNNIQCEAVYNVGEGRPNILDLMKNGQIQWVINTPSESLGKKGERLIRSAAVLRGIPIITTLSGALAAVNGLKQYIRPGFTIRPLENYFDK
jgi:carbamoyl-phosphate synthase large subunit